MCVCVYTSAVMLAVYMLKCASVIFHPVALAQIEEPHVSTKEPI